MNIQKPGYNRSSAYWGVVFFIGFFATALGVTGVGISSSWAQSVEAAKEDLTGLLLTDHARQIGRAKARIKAGNIGIGLFEDRMFLAGEAEIANHMQAVATADRPAWDHRDDDLGHEADQALDFEDVQASESGRVRSAGFGALVLIAIFAANPLIAARTKSPAPVFF